MGSAIKTGFFKFPDFFHDLFYFSTSLGLAVIFENFQNFTCFSIFFDLKQFNRNKLWYPPKCVPFTLFNYSSLSCVILALSSAVTNLPNKTLIFHDFQGLTIKFHNFPGFLWPVRTPQEGVYSMNDFPCPLFLHFISHPPHSVVEK